MAPEAKLSPTLLDTYKEWLDTHSNGNYHGYERGTMFRRHLAFMDTLEQIPAGKAKDKLTECFKDVCLLLMFATESPETQEKIIVRHREERVVEIQKELARNPQPVESITIQPSQMSIVDQEIVRMVVKGNILPTERNYRWRIIVEYIPEDTGAK